MPGILWHYITLHAPLNEEWETLVNFWHVLPRDVMVLCASKTTTTLAAQPRLRPVLLAYICVGL